MQKTILWANAIKKHYPKLEEQQCFDIVNKTLSDKIEENIYLNLSLLEKYLTDHKYGKVEYHFPHSGDAYLPNISAEVLLEHFTNNIRKTTVENIWLNKSILLLQSVLHLLIIKASLQIPLLTTANEKKLTLTFDLIKETFDLENLLSLEQESFPTEFVFYQEQLSFKLGYLKELFLTDKQMAFLQHAYIVSPLLNCPELKGGI